MKAKNIRIINLIVAVLIALFAIGQAFAWFLDGKMSLWQGFGGSSAGAYFAYGTGTEEDPFGIDNKFHMYNLAWLQNTGRLDEEYYFELSEELTDPLEMDNMWLPPIGNDEHPFTGKFNGNGKEISGLKITTDRDLLEEEYAIPVTEDYEFSNAVGMFGMTTKDSEIANIILKNPVVQAATVNSVDKKSVNYATEWDGTDSDTHSKRVIGLAVGHVAGKCYSIGVRATTDGQTTLDLKKTGYSTFNSILGELGAGVESSVTGGGHALGTGGSGSAFGASFDVESLLTRLNKILANKKSASPSWRLPDIDTQNTNPVPDALRKVPFAITDESTYEGEDAIEVVSDQNIGYFIGNQNKIMTSKALTFDEPMVLSGNEWVMNDSNKDVPRWFYSYKTESGSYDTMAQAPSYGKTVFKPLTKDEFDSLPKGILDLLPAKVGDKERFTAVRLSQTFTNTEHPYFNNSVSGWSFHGQINIMGKTYGEGFMDSDGKVVDENRESKGDMLNQWGGKINFYEYTGGIYLPNNAVWFKPQQLGKIKFVMYAEKTGEGFALVKIIRTGATPDNPFYSAPNTTGWGVGDDIFFEPVMRTSLPSGVLLYFEHEVDADELAANNVEYMLMQYGSAGAQFLYLDLGASAAEDTSGIDRDKAVSAIDFIYDGVEISDKDEEGTPPAYKIGDFIVTAGGTSEKYEASKTSVYFEKLNVVLEIVFVRLHSQDDGKTIAVTVTPASSEVTATNTMLVTGLTTG